MYKNQESFIAQLPSYQTKSLYIYFIRITSDALKVDEYDAMRLITIFYLFNIVFCLPNFLREKTGFLIASLPLMILYQLPSLGRLLTPDSLIFLFFTAATFFILNKILSCSINPYSFDIIKTDKFNICWVVKYIFYSKKGVLGLRINLF